MKTTGTLSLTHERVDDIPLLLGFMQQLNFPILWSGTWARTICIGGCPMAGWRRYG